MSALDIDELRAHAERQELVADRLSDILVDARVHCLKRHAEMQDALNERMLPYGIPYIDSPSDYYFDRWVLEGESIHVPGCYDTDDLDLPVALLMEDDVTPESWVDGLWNAWRQKYDLMQAQGQQARVERLRREAAKLGYRVEEAGQ